MSKPTDLASWGSTSTNIVVPSAGVANPGFATGAQVPSGWLNWFMNAASLWFAWLNVFENTAHTWSALQTFNAGIALPSPTRHTVGAGGEPAWGDSHISADVDPLIFYKTPDGQHVRVFGAYLLTNINTTLATLFTLPAGFQPANNFNAGVTNAVETGNVYTSRPVLVAPNGSIAIGLPSSMYSKHMVIDLLIPLF